MKIPRDILQCMADKWPSGIVARTEIQDFTGGLIAKRTIEKIDGSLQKIKFGRKITYRVEDVIDFIAERGELIGPDKTVDELVQEAIERRHQRSSGWQGWRRRCGPARGRSGAQS